MFAVVKMYVMRAILYTHIYTFTHLHIHSFRQCKYECRYYLRSQLLLLFVHHHMRIAYATATMAFQIYKIELCDIHTPFACLLNGNICQVLMRLNIQVHVVTIFYLARRVCVCVCGVSSWAIVLCSIVSKRNCLKSVLCSNRSTDHRKWSGKTKTDFTLTYTHITHTHRA